MLRFSSSVHLREAECSLLLTFLVSKSNKDEYIHLSLPSPHRFQSPPVIFYLSVSLTLVSGSSFLFCLFLLA